MKFVPSVAGFVLAALKTWAALRRVPAWLRAGQPRLKGGRPDFFVWRAPRANLATTSTP